MEVWLHVEFWEKQLLTTTNPDKAGSEFSPSFSVMNAQVTRIFLTLLIYIGGEILEITNRENVILGKPIWTYFWCVNSLWSSFWQMYYMGFDLKLNNLKKIKDEK
jgi:hypothetical protein